MKVDRIMNRYARKRYKQIIEWILELAEEGATSCTTSCRCDKVLNRLSKDGFKVEKGTYETKITWDWQSMK